MKKPFYENKIEPCHATVEAFLSPQPHLHKEIEMIYVKEGEAIAHADKNCYRITEGDLFITFPNQIHYYENSIAGKYGLFIISQDAFFCFKNKFKMFIPDCNVINVHRESDINEYIKKAVNSDGEYRDTIISGYMNLIMAEIIEQLELKPRMQSNKTSLRDILAFCAEHYSEDITLEYVAENLHLSKYYISRLLNRQIDLSFSDYINTLRVNAACGLLEETDKKIADISEDVGFGTIRSFNRAFLRVTNMTPVQYRALQRPQSRDLR